jgi:hypothetical protein
LHFVQLANAAERRLPTQPPALHIGCRLVEHPPEIRPLRTAYTPSRRSYFTNAIAAFPLHALTDLTPHHLSLVIWHHFLQVRARFDAKLHTPKNVDFGVKWVYSCLGRCPEKTVCDYCLGQPSLFRPLIVVFVCAIATVEASPPDTARATTAYPRRCRRGRRCAIIPAGA